MARSIPNLLQPGCHQNFPIWDAVIAIQLPGALIKLGGVERLDRSICWLALLSSPQFGVQRI
jgi:hypothetical protein